MTCASRDPRLSSPTDAVGREDAGNELLDATALRKSYPGLLALGGVSLNVKSVTFTRLVDENVAASTH